MKGNIHSIETAGFVDGPGLRFVVFLQGCPMRCKYCHNPDSWSTKENTIMTTDEILSRYNSLREFFRNGGLTVTGGEPLVQLDFVIELFKSAKEQNIHTALDTSGVLFREDSPKYYELIKYTDLVLLDIKHIDELEHRELTGYTNQNTLLFAKFLSENKIPLWIRHVLVPEITDKKEHLEKLGGFIKTLNTVQNIEILPYHNMAISKYEKLNIPYSLSDTRPAQKEDIERAYNIIKSALGENL